MEMAPPLSLAVSMMSSAADGEKLALCQKGYPQ
jgi:hypothetical protein